MKIKLNVVKTAILSMIAWFSLAGNARAEDIVTILEKTRDLLVTAVQILGPSIGLVFVMVGIMKLRRKDEDPRAASQGIWYIIAGVATGMAAALFMLILNYYGYSTSEVESWVVR
jgi:hypothetical protein